MTDPLSDADIRRARLYCNVAAAVFVLCGAGLLLLPMPMAAAVRGVIVGFNLIIALAVFLYGRQLKAEP